MIDKEQSAMTAARDERYPDMSEREFWAPDERVARLMRENRELRAFAQRVMESWPEGDVDGGALQEYAIACGLLQGETRRERCGESCMCAEVYGPSDADTSWTCYRKTELLTGASIDGGERNA